MPTWCKELTHSKRPWCWERLKTGGEGDDRGWDGWMASPTQWTWVWASSGSWQWTGKPGALLSTESQKVGHDWATELPEWECWIAIDNFLWHLSIACTLFKRMEEKKSHSLSISYVIPWDLVAGSCGFCPDSGDCKLNFYIVRTIDCCLLTQHTSPYIFRRWMEHRQLDKGPKQYKIYSSMKRLEK